MPETIINTKSLAVAEPNCIERRCCKQADILECEWGTLLCNCVTLPKMMGTEGVKMLFSVNFAFSALQIRDYSRSGKKKRGNL